MPCLTLKNVTIYMAKHIICQQLNMDLEPGTICAILGPNGVGKSTLLHTIANLHQQYSGEIKLEQQLICTLSAKERGQRIGILWQEPSNLLTQTVTEYCLTSRYPHSRLFHHNKDLDQKRVNAALTAMHLQTQATKLIHELSGGERKRLHIAALLTQDPDIFLLDEPSNHLDSRYQVHIMQYFQQLAKTHRKTILLTTHDINLASTYCHYVLLLNGAGQIQFGSPEHILSTTNLTSLYQQPIEKRLAWLPI